MHAKRIRELLHDMCNKLVAIDVSTQEINIADLPIHTREHYKVLKENVESIKELLYEAHSAIHEMLHRHYPEYTGEPPLKDKNGVILRMNDLVKIPSPGPGDIWEIEHVGKIISTTRGSGLVCIRDLQDDCWDIEACRVEKTSQE